MMLHATLPMLPPEHGTADAPAELRAAILPGNLRLTTRGALARTDLRPVGETAGEREGGMAEAPRGVCTGVWDRGRAS